MSLSDLITSGRVQRPQRITLYGPNGVGKTHLATTFPNTVVLDTEDGTSHIDVPRIRIKDSAQVFNALRALGTEEHQYRTVAIDTIDSLEKMLRQRVCQNKSVKSIEDIGYGKGWTLLREQFTTFLHLIDDWIIGKGLNALIVGHNQVKKLQPPGLSDSYDRYELKLDPHNSSALREWSDAVLFMNWDVRTAENASGKVYSIGGKNRIIHTMHSAAYDAKNRVGLPEKVDATFEALSPLLSDIVNPVSELTEKLADLDRESVSGYLKSIGWSTDGIEGVSKKRARTALERLPAIRKAIEQFRQEVTPNGAAEPVTNVPVGTAQTDT